MWTSINFPDGPADAPFACCDQDIVVDSASKIAFHSLLYSDFGGKGIVRIFIRSDLISPNADCFYDIDPEGVPSTTLADFPQIELSHRHLFLSINALTDSFFTGFARMYRFDLESMRNCRVASLRVSISSF
jgi:hypothetical protein